MPIAIGLLAIAVIVAIVLLLASRKPDAFHVERSIRIADAPEVIFAHIANLRRWEAWTPYDKDPAMRRTYGSHTVGVGAHFAWVGDKRVGQGELTIRESRPPYRQVMDLHMIKPFEGRSVATLTLTPEAGATRVTWSLDDTHSLVLKVMTLFINMDTMIGTDFEVGLVRLKALVEQARA